MANNNDSGMPPGWFSGSLPLCAGILLLALAGCGGSPSPAPASPAESSRAETNQAQARTFHLEGTVVSVDKEKGVVTVDHKDIPGFMAAMAMPYPVALKGDKMLDELAPGDHITADVEADDNGARLRNIVIVKKGPAAKSGAAALSHTGGETVPDLLLVNQDGKTVRLQHYRGKAVLLTFIYTRCPLAEYCPLLTHSFASIERSLSRTPALRGKTHLLSVSFDPKYDTPAILRSYARSYGQTSFDHWEFATLAAPALKEAAAFFNMLLTEDQGQISHSTCTALISPQGSLVRIYRESDWKPADVLADLANTTSATRASRT